METSDQQPEVSPQRVQNWRARCVIGLVRGYQRGLSPLLGSSCRFQPTCSAYMIAAIEKYGVLKGTWRGCWRILRCHPFHRGGFDPP